MTESTVAQGKALNLSDLAGFTGTETWYRHSLNPKALFTDGAKYVADTAGAYWLIDEIALSQRCVQAVAAEEFQVWKLKVQDDHSAELSCEDGNDNVVFTKGIRFTDFPVKEFTLWCTNNVIMLPSEY